MKDQRHHPPGDGEREYVQCACIAYIEIGTHFKTFWGPDADLCHHICGRPPRKRKVRSMCTPGLLFRSLVA